MESDQSVVARQLGREPRGPWRVEARCSFGHPVVIVTAPLTEDGERFPTLFYLTCPHLVERIAALESAGGAQRWRERLAAGDGLRRRMAEADRAYREARAAESGGVDPAPDVGIAGQRDPCATKCLHAHVAAALAGIADPVGETVVGELHAECGDGRCGRDERWGLSAGRR